MINDINQTNICLFTFLLKFEILLLCFIVCGDQQVRNEFHLFKNCFAYLIDLCTTVSHDKKLAKLLELL